MTQQPVSRAHHTETCLPGCLQVLREGQRQTIPAEELVPGDIVLIKSGDKLPADLRLITSNNLQVRSGLGRSRGIVADRGGTVASSAREFAAGICKQERERQASEHGWLLMRQGGSLAQPSLVLTCCGVLCSAAPGASCDADWRVCAVKQGGSGSACSSTPRRPQVHVLQRHKCGVRPGCWSGGGDRRLC